MATLVFTALGGFLGPIGGALGGLIGRQVDQALFAPKQQAGRLKELGVTTSSYGVPIPRQHGQVRASGSLIWATDLVESEASGIKGQPSVSGYSYSACFAVALSSRPMQALAMASMALAIG